MTITLNDSVNLKGEPRSERLAWSVARFAEACDLSTRMVQKLIADKRLRSVKIGDRRIIPDDAAREFFARANSHAA